MITTKQMRALQHVYTRRIETTRRELRAAMAELNDAKAVVLKHEQTIQSLQSEIDINKSCELTESIAEVVQRERVLYWLNYDFEDIEFRLGNARESLREKQVVCDQCKKGYLEAKQRLDFVDIERKAYLRREAVRLEKTDEELFVDTFTGRIHA